MAICAYLFLISENINYAKLEFPAQMSINGYAMRFVGFLLFLCEIRIIIISECTIHIHAKMILSMQNGTFVFAALEVRSWFDFSRL